jgi:hypothetical protein
MELLGPQQRQPRAPSVTRRKQANTLRAGKS